VKRWLIGGMLSASAAVALCIWWVPGAEPVATVALPDVAANGVVEPPSPSAPAPQPMPAAIIPAPITPVVDSTAEPALNAEEAQVLMQLMADQGDPRSPSLGTLKPREQATPAQLADPAQYQAFEDKQSRALIQAYASGIQQIPAIRERIEQAAQSGERNAEEIDEARAALEQLEMLQSKLQREAPELLPGGSTQSDP
jgi:hypothetical protein